VKIWGFITLGIGVICLPFVLLWNTGPEFIILFWVFLGLSALMGVVTLLIQKYFVSEKPLYQFLYPQIINDINYNESVALTYEANPQNKEFVKIGGLFPGYCTKLLRCKVSFETSSGTYVEVYDAFLYTSTDNSTVVYLNGLYFVVHQTMPLLQLRFSGSPQVKGIHFIKLPNSTGLREFAPADGLAEIAPKYQMAYDRVIEEYGTPEVFLGGTGSQIHLGVGIKSLTRKVKVLNQEIYDKLYNSLQALPAFVDAVSQIIGAQS
jgi:hypothetical protein